VVSALINGDREEMLIKMLIKGGLTLRNSIDQSNGGEGRPGGAVRQGGVRMKAESRGGGDLHEGPCDLPPEHEDEDEDEHEATRSSPSCSENPDTTPPEVLNEWKLEDDPDFELSTVSSRGPATFPEAPSVGTAPQSGVVLDTTEPGLTDLDATEYLAQVGFQARLVHPGIRVVKYSRRGRRFVRRIRLSPDRACLLYAKDQLGGDGLGLTTTKVRVSPH
jgi:hypothetical protein